jgi:hypothetical protein
MCLIRWWPQHENVGIPQPPSCSGLRFLPPPRTRPAIPHDARSHPKLLAAAAVFSADQRRTAEGPASAKAAGEGLKQRQPTSNPRIVP